VFGLGEAGSLIAADLVATGATVIGYDPAPVATPAGVARVERPEPVAEGADLVMALTAAADAESALDQAAGSIDGGSIYADLCTGSAELKRRLAGRCGRRGVLFADVAMMAMVPGRGLATPMLASGPGAERFVELATPLGAVVEAVGAEPGTAATRKLLRSVFMKGAAALMIEALMAAERSGDAEWLWSNLVGEITAADREWVERLVTSTGPHALRRLHEMEASRDQLSDLGVDPMMTAATVARLRHLLDHGMPDRIPPPGDPHG
jgi:3-hydroxyisobutyrate dehydrogenase-like beta-hydroxyacid dehydrogenase